VSEHSQFFTDSFYKLTNWCSGNYEAQQYNPQTSKFELDPSLGVTITVDETFDNDHRIVNQRGASKGRFTFSAADSGEHKLCFQPTNAATTGGWLVGGQDVGGVKLTLDMAIGETSKIESSDKGKVEDLVSKVRDLNGRLQDIRREQVFQRVSATIVWIEYMTDWDVQEREAEFRDQSESTNSRVVRWTLIQLVVLGVTCAWQLSHLRSFFIKQKLT
jgi:hypothetical protein